MKATPINKNVTVQIIPEDRFIGSILLPDQTEKDQYKLCTVIASNYEQVEPGMIVAVGNISGAVKWEENGLSYQVIPGDIIQAIIDPEEPAVDADALLEVKVEA